MKLNSAYNENNYSSPYYILNKLAKNDRWDIIWITYLYSLTNIIDVKTLKNYQHLSFTHAVSLYIESKFA